MRKALIITLILGLIYPVSVLAADNRAIREAGFPSGISNTAATTLGAYGNSQTPNIYVVDTLTYGEAYATETRNGVSVRAGGLEDFFDWDTDNKIAIFEVSGTITCNDRVYQTHNYVAMYGQTAPSPGIVLKGLTILSYGESCVYQHLRLLVNNSSVTEGNQDGINIYGNNNIIDHCTISWTDDEHVGINCNIIHLAIRWNGPDGNGEYYINKPTKPVKLYQVSTELTEGTVGSLAADEWGWSSGVLYLGFQPTGARFYDEYSSNIIVSNSILAEGLQYSNDNNSTVSNSKGLLAQRAHDVLIYGNLFSKNYYRNPIAANYGTQAAIVNNWIADPGNTAYSNAMVEDANVSGYEILLSAAGNVTEDGPAYFVYLKGDGSKDLNSSTELWFDDNIVDSTTYTENDWGHVQYTIYTNYANIAAVQSAHQVADPPVAYGFTATAASSLKTTIDGTVGARPYDRTSHENRIVGNATDGTGTQYSEADLNAATDPNWPTLAANTRNVETDMVAVGFNQFPSSLTADGDADGRSDFMEWIDELTVWAEDGTLPTPQNNYVDDANCIGHYFDGSTVVEDSQSGGNDLNAAAGESEWVSQTSGTSAKFLGKASANYYWCIAIADAGGVSPSKIGIYPNSTGDVSAKTITVYKDTQTGGAGNNLNGAPGTSLGTLACQNSWDGSAQVDITLDGTALAQNELLCLTVSGTDGSNYLSLKRSDTDGEAMIGDMQSFNSVGTWQATEDYDLKTVIYETSGNPPTYASSVADFDGTDDYVYQDITSLHANTPGVTGKDDFAFVFESLNFDAFPTDGNDFTLAKIANVLDCVVKTSGANNVLEMRIYDGSDWDAVWTHASDLDTDTDYDILFSYDSTTFTGVIDIATSADGIRVGTRISSVDGDSITMNDPNSGNLYVGTADGSTEFFNGAVGAFSVWDDQPSAAEFLDIASNDYGSPGPTFDSMTTAADSYTSIGDLISITGTVSEEIFITGAPPYFDCTSRKSDLRFYYASKDGTSITVTSAALAKGQGFTSLSCDANWTLPGGTTVQDENGEDATLTLPAITNAGSVSAAVPDDIRIPADYADYATMLTAYGYLIGNDTLEVTDNANITITDEDGTSGNPIKVYLRAGYSGTLDLNSNDYIEVYAHPAATVSNSGGTGVTVTKFNGAAGM